MKNSLIKDIFAFLKELRENNNREWFAEHKATYIHLKSGYEELVDELIGRIALWDEEVRNLKAKDCVYRIYRDVRFSPDKSPYKTHFGAYICGFRGRNSGRCGYYIHIEPGRSLLGGGCYCPEPALLKRLRQDIYDNMDFFRHKLVLRPSEISNCPEVVRRIGVISMNTAIEADIYGNVNSTHICGTKMMNGIGGSGDFTRSAYISIFSCPSTAKGGCISSIVPMVSHLDHSEHSVNVIITEQGIADLRGKSPMERAQAVIENCAHPDYKQLLWDYLKISTKGQTCHSLSAALGMHQVFIKQGDMRLTNWADFEK